MYIRKCFFTFTKLSYGMKQILERYVVIIGTFISHGQWVHEYTRLYLFH